MALNLPDTAALPARLSDLAGEWVSQGCGDVHKDTTALRRLLQQVWAEGYRHGWNAGERSGNQFPRTEGA